MSDFDFYRQIDKILALADKKKLPDTFDAFSFREDMPGRIRAMIEQYLIDHKRLCLYYCGRPVRSMFKLQ
jgi:hypothetical protein